MALSFLESGTPLGGHVSWCRMLPQTAMVAARRQEGDCSGTRICCLARLGQTSGPLYLLVVCPTQKLL
jgi:hypothetical protein